jgi:hypothetical protein
VDCGLCMHCCCLFEGVNLRGVVQDATCLASRLSHRVSAVTARGKAKNKHVVITPADFPASSFGQWAVCFCILPECCTLICGLWHYALWTGLHMMSQRSRVHMFRHTC